MITKSKSEIINEIVNACNKCKVWYKEIADAGKFDEKYNINARVDIDDTDYIFIECDEENDNLNHFWFSVESELYPYEAIDEQDTADTSEESIRYNAELLLNSNYEWNEVK